MKANDIAIQITKEGMESDKEEAICDSGDKDSSTDHLDERAWES